MSDPSFGERLRYRFDNFMSRGTAALVGALFAASAVIILLIAAALQLTSAAPDDQPPGFAQLVWRSAMRAMDAGTLGGDDGSRLYLFLMLLVTMAGIFIVSALIGILNSGLGTVLDQLRKGRSRVLERDHTLILGWSSQIHTIASEIALAAANHGGATVVIVADRDKVEMDDELAVKVKDRHGTRIICRSGSPIDLDDLALGSPEVARSIIVLGPEGAEDPDAAVIKTVLALVAHKPRREGKHHIVAEIKNPRNRTPALMVAADQAEIVVASEVIARIAVQTCRQAGLSGIYGDLLDFGGNEIYFHREPGVEGKAFGDVLKEFPDSTIIGLRTAEGATALNPPMDRMVPKGAELIAIAEDDDRVVRRLDAGGSKIDEAMLSTSPPRERVPERTLILGWNERGATIVQELDKYAVDGSELLIVARDDGPARALAELESPLTHHAVKTVVGDITDRRLLDKLNPASYEHVITLAYAEHLSVQEADAITLITLLHLRDIEEKQGESFSIVSEMLDTKNRRLAEITSADDFIVSDLLVSLLIGQIAENKHLAPVFEDLFDADGSEIYLKPASDYVKLDTELSYHHVVEAARRRGEIALGYMSKASGGARSAGGGPSPPNGVVLNPKKTERLTLKTSDRVVVLAQD
ncbi:MAG: NAD-binding protein [Polyangiaceae bacterium]